MAGSSARVRCSTRPSRGMSVALVEQDDIAAGTSSRSSRLIHGGLRYLEQFRFAARARGARRARAAAASSRRTSSRIEPLLFPIYGTPVPVEGVLRRRPDALRHPGRPPRRRLAQATVDGRRRWRSRRRCARTACVAGSLYHDGVEDDARYTLAVAAHGARRPRPRRSR